jgi:hypothetical protein
MNPHIVAVAEQLFYARLERDNIVKGIFPLRHPAARSLSGPAAGQESKADSQQSCIGTMRDARFLLSAEPAFDGIAIAVFRLPCHRAVFLPHDRGAQLRLAANQTSHCL